MDAASQIRQSTWFSQLQAEQLQALAAMAQRQRLHSGQRLYAPGDAPDFLYLLLHGRLRVAAEHSMLSYVGRLEPLGELELLADEPRRAEVRAVRDSELLAFPRAPLLALLAAQAPTLLALTRLTLHRLRQAQRQQRAGLTEGGGCFALLPARPGVPVLPLAEALLQRFGGWPQARLITARHIEAALGEDLAQSALSDSEAGLRLSSWLQLMESRHRYLIYAAEHSDDAWALRCLRQADRVLILAEADAPPATPAVLHGLPEPLLAPVELVLLRPEGDASPQTREWCAQAQARAHYFLHPWSPRELDALARQVRGRGLGLVLGGGGARGFAHIGLIRALEQLQIPVHIAGGTSMGAFIAALLALGYDSVEMEHICRETFVNNNFLNDYTMPRVSLILGRRFLARLQEIFGEARIEDLRMSYYCISTSLTTGATVIHDHGPIAAWVGTSMAVPGVAPPIAYKGELLCDGGVVDNLPTDVMQALERGSIIASSVASARDIYAPGPALEFPDPFALFQKEHKRARPSFREILLRTATLTADTVIQREAAERADAYISMPVSDVGLFSWKSLDLLIARGYEHALAQLAPLREQLVGRE